MKLPLRFRNHPGTVSLVFLTLLGALAGGITGSLIMLAIFGPLYLYGAWQRWQQEQMESADNTGDEAR